MKYLHPKFHMPSPNNSLIITIKREAKYRSYAVSQMYYTLQKKKITNFAYFSKSYYGTSFQGSKGTSVPLHSCNFMCLPYIVTDYSKFRGTRLG